LEVRVLPGPPRIQDFEYVSWKHANSAELAGIAAMNFVSGVSLRDEKVDFCRFVSAQKIPFPGGIPLLGQRLVRVLST
jgi:hypothetical protein